jgi:hypothetical protein
MEKTLELKTAFEQSIKIALSNLNVKLNKGYLNLTAKLSKEEIVSLRDKFLELDELGVSIRVKFSIDKVRIKDSSNTYTQIDKQVSIDVYLNASNFQVNHLIKWNNSAGIEETANITSFQISLFTEYISAQDIDVSFIETNIE